MSHVSFEALPLIIPFFGGAVILSLTAMCCGFRRFRNRINYLEERVAALEARPYTPTAPTPPTAVYIPSYPPQHAMIAPPPYSYMAPARASAPPSASF
jgi:hypothetical protein